MASEKSEAAIPREKQFVHLHLHSEYSLLDGGNRLDRLVARVKELGMNAVAVTDHGNMHAAAQFCQAAKAEGIKAILGVEAYVAPGDRTDRTHTGVSDGGYHLVLLAENQTGYQNLLYLCSEAYLTGFYYKPRIDRALLERHHSGLIAINGHLGSEIGEHLLAFEQRRDPDRWRAAMESAQWHARVFKDEGTGPRFYVELQHHIPEQNSINPHLIRLAEQCGLPLVCDNDSHFLRAQDHDAHDTLICIAMAKSKSDPTRLHYSPDLYVKSPVEMREIFESNYGDIGREALDNTVRIAERCNATVPLGESHTPVVRVMIPNNLPSADDSPFSGDLSAWYKEYCSRFELLPFDAKSGNAESLKADCDRALRLLSEAGLIWRYGPGVVTDQTEMARDIRARLDRELRILADKNISAYFLIVWDFVSWGRSRGIPALARGSGVGTMVGYVLGLSNACPVRYGLLFERFTDPDRSEYPDIDIDMCQDGRADVIEYVRSKYGHVAQIITFGTLKARAAIRDVCRVLEVSLSEADKLAKLIPESPTMTLDRALEESPDLRARYEREPEVTRVIDNAKVLEGQARHASVHAAGVIVATRPLHEIVPLYKQPGAEDNEVVTQWDGPTCEKVGLLKMDFLGLRTLSIIERCKALIRGTLAEREIWNAVGRGAEYEEWQSGKVAEWQSDSAAGPGDDRHGAQTRTDTSIQGSLGLAARNGPGTGDLPRNREHATGGDVRADKSDAPGELLHPNEHRGGIWEAQSSGVHPRAQGGDGVVGRTHDGVRTGVINGNAQAIGRGPERDGGRGSADQFSDTQVAGEDSRRAGGSPELVGRVDEASPTSPLGHSATSPLRNSPTSPLGHSATSPLHNHPLDLERLTFDDPRVFALFVRGDTTGVFQFESGGMRKLLVEMKPDRLEDLIAANALFRPGPMDLIPDYNKRKHGQQDVPRVHEIVDRFTAETYGVMVYQEQVMQIVHELGGISLRRAYSLIKAISKKKEKTIEAERAAFLDGAEQKGLARKDANELYELILKFAGYGFNKSHSTGYAIVAYQTAYLKTYFPHQYMAAFLTYESQAQKVADWMKYLDDCRRTRVCDPATGATVKTGVEVNAPDINLSSADFTVAYAENEPRDAKHGHIRFGMRAIKGAGAKAIEAIIAERDRAGAFTSIFDFCERVSSTAMNKTALEALVKSGTFDSIHSRKLRASLLASLPQAVAAGASASADRAAGQGGLFMGEAVESKPKRDPPLVSVPAWPDSEMLQQEKETLGFYVSSHPLDTWQAWIEAFTRHTTATLADAGHKSRIALGAMVQSVRTMAVKRGKSAGQLMAMLTFEDKAGTADAVIFSDAFAKFRHLLESDAMVFAIGEVDLERGTPQLLVDQVLQIDMPPVERVASIDLLFDCTRHNGGAANLVSEVAGLMREYIHSQPATGDEVPVRAFVQIENAERPVPIEMGAGWRTTPSPALATQVRQRLGDGCFKFRGSLPARPSDGRKDFSAKVALRSGAAR